MSQREVSPIFPSIVLFVFIAVVAVGALFSGAPEAPSMPGVKVLATPVIQHLIPSSDEAKLDSETPPSNDAESEESAAAATQEAAGPEAPAGENAAEAMAPPAVAAPATESDSAKGGN